ncbi:MAG: BamA/TamA family outer membrane protein [Chitinophagaceae bacterium]
MPAINKIAYCSEGVNVVSLYKYAAHFFEAMYQLLKNIVFVSFFLCFFTKSNSQSYALKLKGEAAAFHAMYAMPETFESFLACQDSLKNAQRFFIKTGYLAFNFDNLEWSDSLATANVFIGKKYAWASLQNDNIPKEIISQTMFDEKKWIGKIISPEELMPFFEKIISYYENIGYPFASVQLIDWNEQDNGLKASIHVEKGPLTKIQNIILNEQVSISKNYILRMLGIKEGMLYQENKIRKMSSILRESRFLQEEYPWRMYFNIDKTDLHFYLKNKNANRADILIGLMPNNEELGGKFLLTGDVKLDFLNALGYGEKFQLNWQNLQYKSPRMNVLAQLPYLFGSAIGLETIFDYYKKDTNYRIINASLGIVYKASYQSEFKVSYGIASNRLLSINKALLISTRALPPHVDVKYNTLGVQATWQHVDYINNPRKGFILKLDASLSLRNVLKNTDVETTIDPVKGESFRYLYDSIALKTYKYTVLGSLHYFTPLYKRIILSTHYHGGYTYAANSLFKNELFQIGGYKLMRGFDEGSLFLNNYQILTIEPRFLLTSNSYFHLFSDIAYVESKFTNTFSKNYLYSFGVGMLFETRSGLFNISYAVGTTAKQSLQLKNSKIHFGYVNVF